MFRELFTEYFSVIAGAAGVAAVLAFIGLVKAFITVTLPDQLLVVTGKKRVKNGKTFGFSVERGRAFCVPYFQSLSTLDIGILPINVRVEGVNSANGITVGADATACVCIDDDDEGMLYSAVERLMGKDRREIAAQIQQTLIGNFRGALNKATPLEAIGMTETSVEESNTDTLSALEKGERAQFRQELLNDINSDLANFGMKVVSVSLQKIWDTSNYIANLAEKTLAEKRQQVEIEEARLSAIAQKAESDAERRIAVAKSKADGEILKAKEKLDIYRQQSVAIIEQARLEAENAIEAAVNKGESAVQAQYVILQRLKNQTEVTLKAEAETKAAEIRAEGEKKVTEIIEQTRNDILKQKVEMLAEAGDIGKVVLFVQQQLPNLFENFIKHASETNVESMVVMDDKDGINGAVNRGPSAFAYFLNTLEESLGIDVKKFLTEGAEK